MEEWRSEQLRESLVEGLDEANALERLDILVAELGDSEERLEIRTLKYQFEGSIEEGLSPRSRSEEFSPLRATIEGFRRALHMGIEVQSLLEIVDGLPEPLCSRLRMWLLTNSPDLESGQVAEEILNGIGRRAPSGDDLRAIDRLRANGALTDSVVADWQEAFPAPPTVKEIGRALSDNNLPKEWLRAWQWTGVLPSEVAEGWGDAKAILDAHYGPMSEDRYRRPRERVEAYTVGSPITTADLQSLPLDEAIEFVVSWERDPFEYRVGYRELARTLQQAVAADVPKWADRPVEVAARLREPIYISHYLRGIKEDVESLPGTSVGGVIEAIELVFTSPWEPKPQGRDEGWDYDPDWNSAQDAGLELLDEMALKDIEFGDGFASAWGIASQAVHETNQQSAILNPDQDPLTLSLNRHCTKALMALLQLVGRRVRSGEEVPTDAVETLDWVLSQEDGHQFRAVLASRFGFLNHVFPQWVDENADRLFGDAVSSELGRSTLTSFVRWAQPNRWVLERFRDDIFALAIGGEERAVDLIMFSMLWEFEGYEPDQVAETFGAKASAISSSGSRLAFLLRGEGVEEAMLDLGLRYWDAVIALKGPAERLGGFGWFSHIESLDDAAILDRLLATVRLTEGKIEWAAKTSERLCCPPSDARVLEILKHLFLGAREPWIQQEIAGHATSALEQADDALKQTDEYRQIRDSLLARGYFEPSG